jgi:uncharacterized protein (TIGR04255 family)
MVGQLWTKFRERFPRVEEREPIEPLIETFGERAQAPAVRVQVLDGLPSPRLFFLNESGSELIQVQKDRFSHNWRKQGQGDEYPRYEHIRDAFCRELGVFERFLGEEKVGRLIPTQCEVHYVNQIDVGAGWTRHGELGNVVALFSSKGSDTFLPEPEDARMAVRYVFRDAEGAPQGRLHVITEPGYTPEGSAMIVLRLIARGRPFAAGVDGVLRFFDAGREWIVRGFASVTTAQMHQVWGRVE